MAGDRETIWIDNKKIEVPKWATESTLAHLGSAVTNLAEALGKSDDKNKAAFDAIIKNFKDGTSNLDETIADFTVKTSRMLKDLGKEVGGAMMAAAAAAGEKMLSFTGGILKSGALAIVGALGLSFSGVKETLSELKQSFGELNKVGLNLSQGFGEDLAMGTQNVMNEFMGMGLSMQELTGLMTSNSFAMAANRKTFMTTAKTFKDLSNSGIAYGLTVAENNQMLAEELDFKSRMLFQGEVDAEQAAEQADKLFTQQMGYTKLLGKSIEEIRKSSQDLLKGSSSALSLIALQGKAGTKTLDGLSSFASGLIASGVTDDFTAALIEAGTGIDMFAHEATREAFTTLTAAGVDIYGTMSTFRNLAQSGNLTVENAADQMAVFRDQIGNMSEQGMSQLRMMAAAGDANAASMIAMVASVKQAKQSAKDLAKAGGGAKTGEEVYKELLEVEENFRLIGGAFARFRQQIATALLPAIKFISEVLSNKRILTALTNAGTKINQAITGMTGANGLPGMVEVIERFINSASNTVVSIIRYLQTAFAPVADETGEKVAPSIETMFSNFFSKFFDSMFSGLFSAMSFGKIAVSILTAAGALGLIALGVRSLGTGAVLKGTLAIFGISAAMWVLSKAVQNFVTVDPILLGGVFTAIGIAVAGLVVFGRVITGIGGPFAIGVAAIAGAIGVIGLAVRAFPFEDLTNMLNGLVAVSNIKTGAFSALANEIKILAGSILELTNAATGGTVATIGSAASKLMPFGLGGEAKTPIGILADDLERMAAIVRTLPPGMSAGGVGSTPIAATATTAQRNTVTSAAAAPVSTREQELLSEILIELKKSLKTLNRIQETAQNSAT